MKSRIVSCLAFLAVALGLAALFDPAFAQATATAPSVSIPWGSWLSGLLSWPALAAGAAGYLGYAIKSIGGGTLSLLVSDQQITAAVNYALAKVSGAVAGQTLEVQVANNVAQTAFNWIVSTEPALAGKLGSALGPQILAKLSQLGVAPAAPVAVPTVATAIK
jgi:hypothetical protein